MADREARVVVPEGSFALPEARRQYGSSRVVNVVHIDLSLRPDLRRQTLAGICTLRVHAIDVPVTRLDLDAVDLRIDEVGDTDGPLAFVHRNGTLAIDLRAPLERTNDATFVVRYHVEQPRRGLFFIAPSDADPEAPLQCWTHGHAGMARHWFPCIDDAQQRQSSTTTIEVEPGFFALGNGDLIRQHNASSDTTVFRYAQREPHASYLFTMVVGRFVEIAQRAGAQPVCAYVAPGREADAERTFGKTPKMLAALERFSGNAYPYARYSQIAVAQFAFIGMENTTASTLTDEWLLAEDVLASPEVESLVVHELAHQWFGNFVSSTQWTDAWLNEGFASYCEAIWDEAERGWEAYLYNIFCQVRTYLGEAADKYTRPIICDYYRDPIDLFDKHLYEKASAVLHMLRGDLGEARFARAIARYVRDNAGGGVETIDFIRAIERTTGRNMRAFFDQWARRGGHPVVTVTVRYDIDRRQLQVCCTQRQLIDHAHPAYRFTLALGLLDELPDRPVHATGAAPLPGERRVNVTIDSALTTYTIELDRAPALVRIDPGAWTLGDFAFELATDIACTALAHDPDPIARIRAARSLARDGGAQARAALAAAMSADRFWGARIEYATILGEAQAPWARDVLRRATADSQATVRRAVCAALGTYRGAEVAAALHGIIGGEPAVDVVGEALHALGKTRDPAAAGILRGKLTDRSWRDVVGAGALRGIAELGDDTATSILLNALTATWPSRRESALRALPVLGTQRPSERPAIVLAAIEALSDPIAMTRLRAIEALDRLADATAIGHLERLAIREPIPWIRSHAQRAAQRIASQIPALQRLARIDAELQTLRTQSGCAITSLAANGAGTIQSPAEDPRPQPVRPPA